MSNKHSKELLTQHNQPVPGFLLQLPTISIGNVPMHQISQEPTSHSYGSPMQSTNTFNKYQKEKTYFLCIYKVGLQMYNILRSI